MIGVRRLDRVDTDDPMATGRVTQTVVHNRYTLLQECSDCEGVGMAAEATSVSAEEGDESDNLPCRRETTYRGLSSSEDCAASGSEKIQCPKQRYHELFSQILQRRSSSISPRQILLPGQRLEGRKGLMPRMPHLASQRYRSKSVPMAAHVRG